MECAQIVEAFKPLKVTSGPIPEVPDEGVVLKTLYSGICHSDIHTLDDEIDLGDDQTFHMRDVLGDKYVNMVLGHEICGQVIAKGSKVPSTCSIKVGDNVVVFPWKGCQACEVCSNGHSNLCENNQGGTTDIGQNGKEGGFASHIAIYDWEIVVKLPKNIPPEIGCMLPCSVLTSYSALQKVKPALDNAVRTRGLTNLLIIGAGGLGFWTVILVKSLFCDKNVKIIVADVNKEKLTEISNIGADDAVFWPRDAEIQTLVSNTTMAGYNKIDAAIDFVGLPKTCQVGFECLHYGGTLAVVGLGGGQLPISLPKMTARSQSIQGVRTGTKPSLKDLVDLFSVQELGTRPPLEYFKLADINTALDKLRRGEIKGRALLKFTE